MRCRPASRNVSFHRVRLVCVRVRAGVCVYGYVSEDETDSAAELESS